MNIKQNGSDIIMNYVDILSIDVGFKRKEGDRGGLSLRESIFSSFLSQTTSTR